MGEAPPFDPCRGHISQAGVVTLTHRAPPPSKRSIPYTAQAMATIVDFILDPSLLRASFDGPSWDRRRAVLRAAFALPMSRRDRELFAEVAGDRAPPRRRIKELVCAVGRGGGKDSIAAALATYIATTSDFSHLRPGERGTVMCLATDRTQAGIALNYTRGNFEHTPLLAPLIERFDGDTIRLKNRAEITIVTNNIRSPRGRTIACAIYDEAAHWVGEDFAHPDTEVDAAITPGLMRFRGSLKIIISSVHRRAGLLYDKFAKHFGQDDDDVLVVLGTSLEFNPTLDGAEIDRQLALDPEKAGSEYLSRWRDDLTNFLDRQLVEAAIDRGIVTRPPQHGVAYVAFCDPSGGRGDSFTAAVGHREGAVLVVDALFEQRAPFDSDVAIDEVAALLRSYKVTTVRGDNYGADLTVAAFRRRGITYRSLKLGDAEGRQGRLNRSEIYLNSVGLFTAGRARLPDNPRLVHQLINLERGAARSSGHDSVDHPAGGHDDLANAACGCLVALAGKPAPFILSPAAIQRVASMPPRDRFARSGAMTRFTPRQLGLR
jgi:hypothetical protein